MRVGGHDVDVPRAVLVGVALAVVVTLVYGGATSVAAFGAFNPTWEGTADLRTLAGETGAHTEVATNSPTRTARRRAIATALAHARD